MDLRARNIAWLLPFFLSACLSLHKRPVIQDQGFAPPVANLPKPPVTHPELPEAAVTLPEVPLATEADMEEEDVPPPRHRRPPKPPPQIASAAPPTDEDTGVSAIGTLSSGAPADSGRETNDAIAATERSLNGLGSNLSPPDRKIATQVREYLRQAKGALITGDVDGAHNLLAKAKVLLSELSH